MRKFEMTLSMVKHLFSAAFALSLVGCGGKTTGLPGQCSTTKAIINAQTAPIPTFSKTNAGLLLTTHHDTLSANWDGNISLSKCNVFLELLNAASGQIRMWTASHCIRPLRLTSLKLALRDESSSIGGFVTWNLSHPVLDKATKMRAAWSEFPPYSYAGTRDKLDFAFDRGAMWVNDQTSVLAPRTSCENLRWLTQADTVHALCFSIHDLMSLDVTLPDLESSKSQALIAALKTNSKSAITEQAIAEKRAIFQRRIGLFSQMQWITSQEQTLTGYIKNPQATLPSTDPIAAIIARLQKDVFDLPHPEESSFMTPITVTTQDKPAGQNEALNVIVSGNYSSPRLSSPLNDVTVACVRPLKKLVSGVLQTSSELEYRPHAYCPGGTTPQDGHVWYREYQWSRMIGDLTIAATSDYANAISQQLVIEGQPRDWESRVSIVSNFALDDRIDFLSNEPDVVSPFLSAFKIPAALVSNQLYGWNAFTSTGAFLVAMKRDSAKARFLKGDSGSLLLLDGVPIATLYSVDGEETSGGASIRALPTAESEESTDSTQVSGSATGTRSTVENSTSSGGKIGINCFH
jgi:hypothetical protein